MDDRDLYCYAARVTRVIDGDTFEMDVDMGFHIHNHITCRVINLDTPEKFGVEKPLGIICRDFAENIFNDNPDVYIRSYKTDSFGRWLCDVHIIYEFSTENYEEICTLWGMNKLRDSYNEDTILECKEHFDYFKEK